MSEQRYWQSSVSFVEDRGVRIRGYDLEQLIGNLTFTDSVHLLVRGELPTQTQRRVLDAVLTAVLDYALQKSGTVAARYVASANPSMTAALATAVLAVGEHTLDPAPTVRFAQEQAATFAASDMTLDEFAQTTVESMRVQKQRIPGIGHPVFKSIDPRAQKLRGIAVEAGLWDETGDVYEALHRAFTALPGKETIPINDVGMMGLLLAQLEFTPEEATGLAVVSTLPGVVAHVSEEIKSRKPIRIVRPEDVDYSTEKRDLPADWTDSK